LGFGNRTSAPRRKTNLDQHEADKAEPHQRVPTLADIFLTTGAAQSRSSQKSQRTCGTLPSQLGASNASRHLYNLLDRNDRIRATALRKVQNESATGSTTTTRVRTTLTILVEKTDFDVQAGALHVSGPVVEENKYVKMGQYHTLDLETQRNVTILKDEWDSVALGRIKEACDVTKKAEVGAVVMQEGSAPIEPF
jgi:eRF1 domain 1